MQDFFLFLVVGFLAQAVDGALGMAYGVISSTTLLAFGVSPAHASAAVHAAELFATAASGSAHIYHRNIDWKLFWRLAPFGIIGGCAGAYVLTSFEGDMVKPFVTAYLALVGVWLLVRSFRKVPSNPVPAHVVAPLGAAGGFLDAAGGGGWGPIVTTGLLSVTFLVALVTGHWTEAGGLGQNLSAIGGLILGGLIAAPLAGYVVKSLREVALLRIVGVLIVLLAGWQTAQILDWV